MRGERSPEGKSGLWGWVAGLSALVVGGLIVFLLTKPGGALNPNPPASPTPAPTLAGHITKVDLSVTRPCCTYSVQAHIQGYQGQQCPMTYIVIDARTGAEGAPQTPMSFVPNSSDDTGSADISVPLNAAGVYYLRFLLYDPNHNELDRQQTSPITVTVG